jgi:REP element-mobilizing transposase RayT
MSWEIRVWRAGAVYHITNRTYRGELRLTPDDAVNLFVEGCLAKAAKRYGVRIIDFIVMGHHFHLILQAPFFNLDQFMGYFQRELSHRLNAYRGEAGSNFPKRYQCEEIASSEDFEREVARVLCNPVRARLVGKAEQWPGVSSLEMHRAGVVRKTVRHASRGKAATMREAGLTPALERSFEELELELSPPPFWSDLEQEEVQTRISSLVEIEQERVRAEIKANNERVIGPSRIRNERHDQTPDEVHWRAYRRIVSKDSKYAAKYHDWYRRSRRRYWAAADLWRTKGEWGDYPPGTFPPGWLRCLPPSSEAGPPLPWREHRLQAA